MSDLLVPARFCGPPVSGNGGWTCGAMAQLVHGQPGRPQRTLAGDHRHAAPPASARHRGPDSRGRRRHHRGRRRGAGGPGAAVRPGARGGRRGRRRDRARRRGVVRRLGQPPVHLVLHVRPRPRGGRRPPDLPRTGRRPRRCHPRRRRLDTAPEHLGGLAPVRRRPPSRVLARHLGRPRLPRRLGRRPGEQPRRPGPDDRPGRHPADRRRGARRGRPLPWARRPQAVHRRHAVRLRRPRGRHRRAHLDHRRPELPSADAVRDAKHHPRHPTPAFPSRTAKQAGCRREF